MSQATLLPKSAGTERAVVSLIAVTECDSAFARMRLDVKELAVLIANLLLISSCSQPAPVAAPQPKVEVAQPIARTVTDWDEYTARLDAVESVEIRPRVSGYLQTIHFRDGAMVKKGDLLFLIDPRPYEAALRRTEADFALAKARLALAQKNQA